MNNCLRSIIIQLLESFGDISNEVQSLHDKYNGKQPTYDDLVKILFTLLKPFSQTYILIDALDECCERSEMVKLLRKLVSIADSTKLLITS